MELHKIEIKTMQPTQIKAVIDLIQSVFMHDVAPSFSDLGIQEFLRYADKDKMLERQEANHFSLVASANGTIIGIIEIRNCTHISLLFVDSRYQRMGIGKALFQHALHICMTNKPDVIAMSVNASPNAVSAYKHFGFIPTDKEINSNGIRFTPMRKSIKTG